MGIYHLMGLGTSIGAVTVSWKLLLEAQLNPNLGLYTGSGEISGDDESGKPEALVIFTSEKIKDKKDDFRDKEEKYKIPCLYKLNDLYNSGKSRKEIETSTGRLRCLVESRVEEDLRAWWSQCRTSKELKGKNTREKSYSLPIYWVGLPLDNFSEAFRRVYLVLKCVRNTGKLGKEIWLNLTGGTNLMNLALLSTASLIGGTALSYYTYAEGNEIRNTYPWKSKDRFIEENWFPIPFFPTQQEDLFFEALKAIFKASFSKEKGQISFIGITELYNHLNPYFLDQFKSNETQIITSLRGAGFVTLGLEQDPHFSDKRHKKFKITEIGVEMVTKTKPLLESNELDRLTIKRSCDKFNWIDLTEVEI